MVKQLFDAPGAVSRAGRVSGRIKTELESMLSRGQIRDPRVKGVWISSVRVTDDLKHAYVLLRLIHPEVDDTQKEQIVNVMNQAQKFIRKEMAQRLKLRYAPKFRFEWDYGVDHALRMEQVFDEIRQTDPKESD